jgi:nitroreductase/NAD-dependent dihydropyrimidine dehydrogenase PreA subunit
MSSEVTTVIDPERCIGCGLCVRVCPAGTLSMQSGKAVVSGTRSMACGHCHAGCPADAVRVKALAAEASAFDTFRTEEKWLPPGRFEAGLLVQLMRSRRSCRNYLQRAVDKVLLTDLVRAGITAPSGTNSQKWTFTALGTRKEVVALGEQVAVYFERLNRLAVRPLARLYSRFFAGDALGRYYRDHYKTTAAALLEWREEGKDRLFHGATAAILVGSRPGASCPAEDALLATQNILLAAHALGLGSCLIGFVVEAMKRDPAIKKTVAVPVDEPVYSVIALGWPDERYQLVSGRKWPVVRFQGRGDATKRLGERRRA